VVSYCFNFNRLAAVDGLLD